MGLMLRHTGLLTWKGLWGEGVEAVFEVNTGCFNWQLATLGQLTEPAHQEWTPTRPQLFPWHHAGSLYPVNIYIWMKNLPHFIKGLRNCNENSTAVDHLCDNISDIDGKFPAYLAEGRWTKIVLSPGKLYQSSHERCSVTECNQVLLSSLPAHLIYGGTGQDRWRANKSN